MGTDHVDSVTVRVWDGDLDNIRLIQSHLWSARPRSRLPSVSEAIRVSLQVYADIVRAARTKGGWNGEEQAES